MSEVATQPNNTHADGWTQLRVKVATHKRFKILGAIQNKTMDELANEAADILERASPQPVAPPVAEQPAAAS